MRIRHRTLRGVEPSHLAWWFRNIGGDVVIDGVRMTRYHAWHPVDHIHWALERPGPGGGAGVGARFRIVEAFGGDMHMLVDVSEEVLRLDDCGITLANSVAGLEVSRLSHDFLKVGGGTDYVSCLTVGLAHPLLARPANALLRRFAFSEAKGRAWLKHNVEEVGVLEHLLPHLAKTGAMSGLSGA